MKNILFILFFLIPLFATAQTPVVSENKQVFKDSVVANRIRLTGDTTGLPENSVMSKKQVIDNINARLGSGSTVYASDGVYKDGDTVKLGGDNISNSVDLTFVDSSYFNIYSQGVNVYNNSEFNVEPGRYFMAASLNSKNCVVKIDGNGISYDQLPDTTLTTPTHLMTEQQVKLEIAAVLGAWTTTSTGIKYAGSANDSVTFNKNGGLNIFVDGVNRFNVMTNTSIGEYSNRNNGGTNNISIGPYSLYDNIGNTNIALGFYTLNKNTSGTNNIAIGTQSSQEDTSGYDNITIGRASSFLNKKGYENIAIGAHSNYQNTTGNNNICIGYRSGYFNSFNNRLFINSLSRSNISEDSTKSIIYGLQDATVANQRVYLNGRVYIAEDLYYKGTFAGIYVSDGSTAQSIPTGTTYTKLTGFATNGENSNCTSDVANDKITITKIGRYFVSWSMSLRSGTNLVDVYVTPFLGAAEQSSSHAGRRIGTGTDLGAMAGSGFINVTSVPVDLDLRARTGDASSVNITPVYMNLTVQYVGN